MNHAGDVSGARVEIRQAVAGNANAIGALVSRLTREYILPEQPEGAAEKLLSWMTATAIAERIAAGHRYHIAESAEGLLASRRFAKTRICTCCSSTCRSSGAASR